MPICSYCGQNVDKTEKEHVFPSCLYPISIKGSKVQRLTIKACRKCKGSWSDDEAHFRNVLSLSIENPIKPRQELWNGPILRSFDQPDGMKRIYDLLSLMKSVETLEGKRQLIFPGEDERVLRVVRKIIRGLAHHHGLALYVPEKLVWADVKKYEIPKDLIDKMSYHHREPVIAEYWYEETDSDEISSAWLIRFFKYPTFVGYINK